MEFNILQYLPENTKIKINGEIMKEISSNKSVNEWAKFFNIPLKNMSRYLNGSRAMPIDLLNKWLNLMAIDNSRLQNKISLKITKSGNYLKIGPFINIDENWAYISELIRGDGHITKNFWSIIFVNNNKTLVKCVKDFFKSLGVKQNQMSLIQREDANFLIIRSSLLSHLFNKILNIPVGKKGELSIPKFVILDRTLCIAAVRGAFDAEGSVTFTSSRRISITSNSKRWLVQLKQILENLRIESRIFQDNYKKEKPLYRLLIYHYINLRRFKDIIKPLHTKRKQKLNKILNNYTKNPQRLFHKQILLSVKKGRIRKRDIAKDTELNLMLVGNNLNWLRKKEYIIPFQKICTNNGCFHKYKLSKKGEEYIKNSLSFFD